MALISLTYMSVEAHPMAEEDLVSILEASKNNNSPKNITGMLLYKNGYFIQALEGEAEDVDALYRKIEQDQRHGHCMVVQREPIEQRTFGEWSMGFQNLETMDPRRLEGYTDFLDNFDPKKIEVNKNRAVTLLDLFRHGSL